MAEETMKSAKLRELSTAELSEKVDAAQEELFNLRFQAHMGQLGNPLKMRSLRRDIARVKTILRQKQTGVTSAKVQG